MKRPFRRDGQRRGWRLDVRHLPWLLAGLTALATLVATRPIARAHARQQRAQVLAEAERDLELRVAAVLTAQLAQAKLPEDGFVWLVDTGKRTSRSLAPTDIEPPLFNLAAASRDNPNFDQFSQRDRDFIAYTRPVTSTQSIVAIADRSGVLDDQHALGGRERRSVLFPAIAIGLLTWLGVRLLLRPATRTLATRQDFLADAAHEMRSPLAVIQASAGHALSRPRSTEEYVRSLAEIRSAAERAAVGVTELLDLARFEAGQAVPRLAPLRLDLLAEEVSSGSRFDDCEVTTEVGPSVVVDADMALLRQAVDNVVRNAASRSTQVLMTTVIDGRDGVLTIADNGPGIPPDQLPYVFERFRRADRTGSSGLGLAIVSAILAAHGGRAEASNGDDGGAKIVLRVPRSRMHTGA